MTESSPPPPEEQQPAGAPPPQAAHFASPAAGWPAAWGGAAPTWDVPSPTAASGAATPRRPMFLAGAAMLAVGRARGAGLVS